ncbi:MAG TPA: hypothetical protein VL654_13550 [Casimicrobiaceae bacterium]|nr:hypothetical protein [Casimicrobiaceae bacterium]
MADERRDAENASLPEFLAPGVVADDLPALFPLLAARQLLRAFTTLFHGGDDAVVARLLVLREIGLRGADPHWSPGEIEACSSPVRRVRGRRCRSRPPSRYLDRLANAD